MKITAAIITLNEQLNINACLKSVEWADEILVIDAGSKDRTVAQALSCGARVIERHFTHFSDQKNAALDAAKGEWVLFIDADERVPSELARRIQKIIAGNDSPRAYAPHRKSYFFGHPLAYSGTQDDYPVRLFPRTAARFEQPVHERVVTDLPVVRLKEELYHYSTRNFSHYRAKLDLYIPLELKTMASQSRKSGVLQAALRPPAKFLKLYFLQGGILDGWTGLQYAALSSWYDYLKWSQYHSLSEKKQAKAKKSVS